MQRLRYSIGNRSSSDTDKKIRSSAYRIDRPLSCRSICRYINAASDYPRRFSHRRRVVDLVFLLEKCYVATLLYVGAFSFGVSTSITLFYNGFVVGYALSGSENVLYSIILLVPHAIVEVPAFWLAGAAGLRVPFELIRYCSGNQETVLRKSSMKRSGRQFAFAILLLGVAGWIEAIVTPMVASAF
ncbi:stage II sporulation protein M [Haloterrigena salifodinae]|uniref:Stage II sporulation protein M n=1 Tax=Haloterrigena salifodinae TaxID=2675099 RepID=A0A8T8DWM3_9EURY|nr:stage II sporulation protein M [Haloterrigena salifodinae]